MKYNHNLAESFLTNTPRGYILRGTPEWENREAARFAAGAELRSAGTITESNRTNGSSAQYAHQSEL